jgi:hypothetical protein
MIKKKIKKEAGRPPAITKSESKHELLQDFTVQKLIDAFRLDCTVEEACAYADISKQTFYTHCEKNKTFLDVIETARTNLILQSRKVISQSIESGNEKTAQWYLERKRRNEFATKSIEETTTLTAPTAGIADIDLSDLSDQELDQFEALIAKTKPKTTPEKTQIGYEV